MDDPVRMTVTDVRIRVLDPDPGLASDRTAVPSPDLRARRARAPCGSTRDPDLRNADVLQANSSKDFAINENEHASQRVEIVERNASCWL